VNDSQKTFLLKATAEAIKAAHPFPKMAACEAALESNWGNSHLACDYKNLFGMKAHKHPNPAFGVVRLPTKEFENGEWISTGADWVIYPDWASCFADRLATLKRLASVYIDYAAALAATTAEGYVTAVSKTWSTDPARAEKVLSIYEAYSAISPVPPSTPTSVV
jgi:flagellum-specific peptidoglycan hydrolase FlgJ